MDPPVLPECGGCPTEPACQALPSWAWLTRAGQMDWFLKQQFRNSIFPSLPLPRRVPFSSHLMRAPPPGRGGTLASGSETLLLDGLGLRGSGILFPRQPTAISSFICLSILDLSSYRVRAIILFCLETTKYSGIVLLTSE